MSEFILRMRRIGASEGSLLEIASPPSADRNDRCSEGFHNYKKEAV